MIIAIGSKNKTKINACKVIFRRNATRLGLLQSIRFISRDISPFVNKMPMSIDAMMHGARERAVHVFNLVSNCKYAVGAEGGLFLKYEKNESLPLTFLQSWVFCFDGIKGYWGSSGAVPVPWEITAQIINNNEELAAVIDRVSGKKNVRSGIGAVGILTDGQIVRQNLFEDALQFALSPFYNSLFK
jgi:inosine/xanthosine triphosphatase